MREKRGPLARVWSACASHRWWFTAWIGVSLVSWLVVLVVWRGDGAVIDSPSADWALKAFANVTEIASIPARLVAIVVLSGSPEVVASSGGLRMVFAYHVIAWGIVVIGLWFGRVVFRGVRAQTAMEPDPARRRFLKASLGATGAVSSSGGVVGAYATLVEPGMLRTTRYIVPIEDLPADLDGLKIAHLSDTHLGRRVTSAHISKAVQAAIDLAPDVFVLTGDYVSGEPALHPAATDLLKPLAETGRPVVSVLGNHDWFHDGPDMSRCLAERGLNPIDNDHVFLDRDRRLTRDAWRGALALVGVGDLTEHVSDLKGALRGIGGNVPRVLLSHQPDVAELEQAGRVDLMLSGHTHGGQVRLPLIGSPIVPSLYGDRYAYGLKQGPWCPVLITSGVGVSILPVRFGIPPEVVEVTLSRAGA